MSGVCPYCGAELPPAPEGARQIACPVCAQELDAPGSQAPPLPPCDGLASLADQLGRPASPPPPPPDAQRDGPAWEGEGGLVGRLWHTTWQVMLHPVRTLAAKGEPGLRWPLSYGLILGTLASAGHLLWTQALGWSDMSPTLSTVLALFAPLQVLVSLFVTAGVIHAMLFILGGAKQGFRATFRALAYTQAAGVWMLVPALGLPLALVWGLAISTGALAAVHGIGKGRAFSAFLLPLFLGLVIAALLGMALGLGALVSTMQSGRSGIIPGF